MKIMFYESEEFYRNLINHVKDYAIFATDPNGVIVSWNEGCKIALGYDRDEFIGQHVKMLFTPEGVTGGVVDKEFELAARDGSTSDDRWMMRKDGERFWSSGVTMAARDDQGKLVGFTKVMRDLTERKRIEEELRRSQFYMRTLIESLPQLIWTCRPDGECDYLSPQWVRYTGVPESEQLGYGWLNQLHPDDRGPALEAWEVAIEWKSAFDTEYRIHSADGNYRWFKARARPLRSAEGEIFKWFGSNTDIEDQKRVEASLRESEAAEAYIAAIVESSDDAIISSDLQGAIRSWNHGAEKLYGYTEAEAIGEQISMLIPPGNRHEESLILGRIGKGERISHYETIRRRKDGTDIDVSLTASPVKNQAGDVIGMSKTARDITWRKSAESERERLLARESEARADAEEANRLKDEFLATISHELRSPLNAILGWARLLRDPSVREEQLERALEIIERNSQAQARLIEDLLDVSRIVSGKLSVEMRPVAMNSIVQGVVADMHPSAEAKNIDLRLIEDGEINLTGDADRLQQVVWNLLSNAIKFTPEGGRIEVELKSVGERAELRVSDTGRGINSEFLPHVFDRFSQATGRDSRARAGLGLGLTIVRYIVEAHGGSVKAESAGFGHGATFTCAFPLAGAEVEAVPAVEIHEPHIAVSEEQSLKGVKVLVVDDDEDARDVLRAALNCYGAEVTTVTGAPQALDTLASEKIDVLVSDINMPGMDGYELIRRVRAMAPEQGGLIPAIALTAYARAEDRLRALQSGYQTHVPKPVEPAELEIVVATLAKSFRGYG
ncbi:MAG: PAS domain S-box protein [Chloracidobacterium sp.]|nr:PAS domain S-box protein [Chloracidobacterium sp.]